MSIQIGRKYVIVNSWAGNDGRVVTVTGYAGSAETMHVSGSTGERYYVDAELTSTWGGTINHAGELQLKPIDDDSQWEAGSWGALKGIWTPSPSVTA
jgi:hypothetical protein